MTRALVLERFDCLLGEPGAGFAGTSATSAEPESETEAIEADPQLILAAELASLHEAITGLNTDLTKTQEQYCKALTAAFVDAVGASLPTLLDQGFLAELSLATHALLRTNPPGAAQLRVNPARHDQIADMLARIETDTLLEIVSDPQLMLCQAHLTWNGGGADFDLSALGANAMALLETRLAALQERTTRDD